LAHEFIELNGSRAKVLEDAGVEFLGLEAGAHEPGTQGAFADAPNPFEHGGIHAFGQEGQGFGDASGVGLQAVQDGLAADGELVAAGLTAQVLDPLVRAALAPRWRAAPVQVWAPAKTRAWRVWSLMP
jgi:hypothetical protein